MTIFELQSVKVTKAGKVLLGPIDWRVAESRISVILGPSGSGKTTLLRLLNRLDDPGEGRILYRGKPIDTYPIADLRRHVGMVFQRSELFPGTVKANILWGPAIHDLEIDPLEIATMVGLSKEMLDKDVSQLSGGESQKVSIGRAISVGPSVLLLDEPTSGLDPTATLQIEELVKNLVDRLHLTCIFVTHDMEQARRVGDDGILLIEGRKVEEGDIDRLLNHPRDDRTLKFIRGQLR